MHADNAILPFITVIMPIRNEEKYICRSLGAVLNQDYPHDRMEVIIADGRSTDRTLALIDEVHEHSDIHLVVVDNPEQTVPYGFNRALDVAQGEIILRVDGHTVISPDYVTTCVEMLERSGCDNVGGRMEVRGENYLARVMAAVMSSPFGLGHNRFTASEKEELVDTVSMGAWRRHIFEQIGGFDVRFVRSQDAEFNYRLRAHGGKILLSPHIKSVYYTRTNLRRLLKQYYQYGFYKIQVLFRHPKLWKLRQLVPPVFLLGVLSGIVVLPLAPSTTLHLLWMAVITVYLLLDVLFSMQIALRERETFFPVLLLIFPIIHIGWSLGFFSGLFGAVLRGTAPEKYEATFQLNPRHLSSQQDFSMN